MKIKKIINRNKNIDLKYQMKYQKKHQVRLALILISIFFLLISVACSKEEKISDASLDFSGDISSWLSIQEISQSLETKSFTYHEETVDGYLLEECIDVCEPVIMSMDIYLQAKDGFMVKLDGDTISSTYLAYINGQGWSYVSDKHPVNSRVKEISKVIIVSNANGLTSDDKLIEGIDPDYFGLNIISGNNNIYYTKGELLILNNKQFIMEDGISSLKDISISVLKQKQGVELTSLYNEAFSKLLIYTFTGEEYYEYNKNGIIEVTSDQINYISEDLSVQKLNVVGLMIDPIGTSNMNNYYDVQYFLEKDMKVLTILLDGFSYEQYEALKKHESDLVLANISNVEKAKTVYKPVTNAGFAAMLTGVEPIKNGILNRDFREIKVPTIFDYCEETGKSHALIEGNTNILKVNTNTYLNLDQDGDGFTDNEIMDTAREVLKEELDYTFIHFHSIDDIGHDYGPSDTRTIDQIKVIDTYLEEIISNFNGQIIITADHGMHKVSDYGDHGDFRYEDMFVPYMMLSGGKNE